MLCVRCPLPPAPCTHRAAGNTFQPRRQQPSRIDYVLSTLNVKRCDIALQRTPQGHSYSDHFALQVCVGGSAGAVSPTRRKGPHERGCTEKQASCSMAGVALALGATRGAGGRGGGGNAASVRDTTHAMSCPCLARPYGTTYRWLLLLLPRSAHTPAGAADAPGAAAVNAVSRPAAAAAGRVRGRGPGPRRRVAETAGGSAGPGPRGVERGRQAHLDTRQGTLAHRDPGAGSGAWALVRAGVGGDGRGTRRARAGSVAKRLTETGGCARMSHRK